ncbi:MAG: hypothetical protein C0602_08060 [Denitrovibrio sp.]|nr:MAG: hypothetical protein C0602_08060 [Denitrovibrio sp.]
MIIVIVVRQYMYDEVLEHTSQKAQMIIERTVAVHEYVAKELRPAVNEKLAELDIDKDYFDPRWMSAGYISRNINKYYSSRDSGNIDYTYKMFSINARAAESEADPYEREIVAEFKANPEDSLKEEVREIDGKSFFVVYKKNVTFAEGCMRCHSEPENAPAGLIDFYGDKNGFNRDQGDISAILSIRIPISSHISATNTIALKLSGYLIIIYFLTMVLQLVFVRKSIIEPIRMLSGKMKDITQDNKRIGETLPTYKSKEFEVLSSSFNHMSESLKDMTDNLQDKVEEKTQQLTQLNSELEKRVKDESESKVRAERKLVYQKRFADIGQIFQSVAHQWRQPINTLGICFYDLKKTFQNGDIDKNYIDEHIGYCNSLTSHMNITISDFMSYFTNTGEMKKFNPLESVCSVVRLMKSSLSNNNISFRMTYKNSENSYDYGLDSIINIVELPETFLCGYEGQFKQVIMNLLQNSVYILNKQSQENAEAQKEIDIIVSEEKHSYVVTLCDTGGGVPETVIDKIFDPYFTTKGENEGSGIGLNMVKNIVEDSFKGKIKVHNNEGGACFVIDVPIAEEKCC